MIDTHAHLGDDASAQLERARAVGVTRVLAVGTTLAGSREALAIAAREEGVFGIVGVHPHEAGSDDALRLSELRELLRNDRAVAVGETGLDFFRDYAPRDAQERLFAEQLSVARETGKPVVIHTRNADDATAAALRDHDGCVVLHCFSSPGLLPLALERRWYVSFAGNVTFPKAPELRAAAAEVPADRILAETDAPYLAPQPVRGRANEPANVVHTLAALAEVRGVEPAALEAQIDANASAAFSLG